MIARRFLNIIVFAFTLLATSCEQIETPNPLSSPIPSTSSSASNSTITSIPNILAQQTRPPRIRDYCWNREGKDVRNPSEPPEPFLYLPLLNPVDSFQWTAQMDHIQPNYSQQGNYGEIASLGEIMSPLASGSGLAGGTLAYKPGFDTPTFFPSTTPISEILKSFRVLMYQSRLFETYLAYDGHDGHDFGVKGDAFAAADGVIAFVGDYQDALGRVVEIYHPEGYLTRYAHLASYANGLIEGASINAGDAVGTIGRSGYKNGVLDEKLWRVHLHFAVFRWNSERSEWEITDPFGWDPWAGPDTAANLQKQREDPLYLCNGEVSYNLWTGGWPAPYRSAVVIGAEAGKNAGMLSPSQDRYLGGWLGDEPENITESVLTVQANKMWTDTGVAIEVGDLVEIEYQNGLWTHWVGTIPLYDADGYPDYICARIQAASRCIEPIPDSAKGALIVNVSDIVT